jgi:hypothetical protein
MDVSNATAENESCGVRAIRRDGAGLHGDWIRWTALEGDLR